MFTTTTSLGVKTAAATSSTWGYRNPPSRQFMLQRLIASIEAKGSATKVTHLVLSDVARAELALSGHDPEIAQAESAVGTDRKYAAAVDKVLKKVTDRGIYSGEICFSYGVASCLPLFAGCLEARYRSLTLGIPYHLSTLDQRRAELKQTAERYSKLFRIQNCGSIAPPDLKAHQVKLLNQVLPYLQGIDSNSDHKNLADDLPNSQVEWLVRRCSDPHYVLKKLHRQVRSCRELIMLRLGVVGHAGERYATTEQVMYRKKQLDAQLAFLQNTMIMPVGASGPERNKSIALADAGVTPTRQFSKLYTFINAIYQIGMQEGLAFGMLTLTLQPEWHPNPMYGSNTWNGESPRAANTLMADTWRRVLHDLHGRRIGITGLRVVEPHQDACPHWHVWFAYRPQFEQAILTKVMEHFPGRLKYRTSSEKRIFADMDSYLHGRFTVEGAGRVETTRTDFVQIDPNVSSGATYLMKYLLKTMRVADIDRNQLSQPELDLLDSSLTEAATKLPTQEYDSNLVANRVDAYRSVWGFRAYDFFGLTRCLQVWDELRRMTAAPRNYHVRKLWALARGTAKPGRIKAGDGIRGDAIGFIKATGSMKAVEFEPKGTYYKFGLLKEDSINSYGEPSERIVGIRVYQVERKMCTRSYVEGATGCVKSRTSLKSVKAEVASIKTRIIKWCIETTRAAVAESAVAAADAVDHLAVKMEARGLAERQPASAEPVTPAGFMEEFLMWSIRLPLIAVLQT